MTTRFTTLVAAAAAVIAAFGALPAAAQPAPKKVTFLTNYVYNGRHAPFFVGVEKGFYKEAGFDVEIAPATGSGFVITAVDSGKADYGMADVSSVIQAVAKGAKVKGFSVYTDVSTNGLASLEPLPTPASVIGRKIAASSTDSVRVILPMVFDAQKLDTGKIEWQSADPGVYFSLLLGNQVDAITATSDGDVPALSRVAATQNKSISFASFADWGYDIFGFVLVGQKAALERDPAEARRFADATAKAVRYASDYPDETAAIMVKANPTMNRDTVLAQWSGTIKSMNTPYVAANGYGTATTDRIQRSIDLVRKAMKIEAPLQPADVYVGAR